MHDAEAYERNPGDQDLAAFRERAWRFFQAGEFDQSIAAFTEIAARWQLASRELGALVEMLIDRGDRPGAAAAIELALAEMTGLDAVHWAWELLNLRTAIGEPTALNRAAKTVLETAAISNTISGWTFLADQNRLRVVESVFTEATELLDALEQQALAPVETGLPAAAFSRIEEIGHTNASNTPVSREAERVLHALGEAAAAYRVERSRGAIERNTRGWRPAHPPASAPSLAGLKIAIAGGYPALRAAIRRDLQREKVNDVREIPSAWEGSRVERDVLATLGGVDVAVVLVRQIGHSTSGQIKRAAQKAGVPILLVESAGTAGARRALHQFQTGRSRP